MAVIPVSLVTAAFVFLAPTSVHLSFTSPDQQTHGDLTGHKNIIAQKYGGADPHGDDPHGGDPHDENHDDNMKANADEKASKAPKDVYGGKYDNTQSPY